MKEAGVAPLSHWTGAVGLLGSTGSLASVTVWMSAFVAAFMSLTETHGVNPVSPTAIGAELEPASPWSATRAWALMFGVNPSNGRNRGTCSCVAQTSAAGPAGLSYVALQKLPFSKFTPPWSALAEALRRRWKF